MRTPNAEVIVCLALGILLFGVGDVFYANASWRIAFSLITGGFLLAAPALALAYHRAPGTKLARVSAWVIWASSLVLVLVHLYGALVAARTPTMVMIGMPFVGVLVLGLALGAVSVARAGLQSGAFAALVPISIPVWFGLEEALPAWGGVVGAALFGTAALAQVVAMRRSLASPMIEHVGRTAS